jgi:hypothetical protein
MEEDFMSTSLDYAKKLSDFLKSLMMISLFSMLFMIFCTHFRELDINLEHVKFSAFGAEVEGSFSKQQIASQLEMEGVDDPPRKGARSRSGLKPDEADRLMYVGNLQGTCEFARPSPKTKRYIEIDHQLKKKGLVAIKPDQLTYELEKKHGEYLDQGFPISCYQMKLTDQGFNVKAALVKTLGRMFESNTTNPRLAMK